MSSVRSNKPTKYDIRSPEPKDHPAIRELFEVTLDSDRSKKFWEWKHLDNPFGETYWLIAEVDDQIVGARAFMQWRWRKRHSSYRAVRAVDTATHPDWRRRGIFTNLTSRLVDEVRDDGVDFIFNTPNEKSRPGYLKMGWEIVDRVLVWVKPLRPLKAVKKLLPPGSDESTSVGFNTSNVDNLIAEMPVEAVIDSTFEGETKLHTDRSAEYLRWRYHEIPDIEYRTAWKRDGDTGAFAIYRRRKRGGLTELMLSEVVATPGVAGVRMLRELLGEITSEVETDYAIGCAARNTTEMWGLALSGFIPAPKVGPTLVYRQLSGLLSDDFLRDWSSWRCGIGELALF